MLSFSEAENPRQACVNSPEARTLKSPNLRVSKLAHAGRCESAAVDPEAASTAFSEIALALIPVDCSRNLIGTLHRRVLSSQCLVGAADDVEVIAASHAKNV